MALQADSNEMSMPLPAPDPRDVDKLAAGDLLLYPPGSVHLVEPVAFGGRDACFFWVQSLVRDHEARAMLFALDRAIQSLPSGTEQIVELTALYHNLLRRWSTP